MTALLQATNLALGYPDLTLFRGLNLALYPGTTLAVLGANGSGKTTLIKALLGLVDPISGSLHWPTGRPKEIGYLGQLTEFDRRFPMRARELAAMGTWRSLGFRGNIGRAGRNRIALALDEVGVLAVADQPLHTLSAGQLQRVLFARVILQDAPLVLLDEPFAAVDELTQQHLLGVIARWRGEGRAIVLVVHDLMSMLNHCSQVLLLGAGQASHGTPDQILTPERLIAQGYLSQSHAAWILRDRANLAGTDHA